MKLNILVIDNKFTFKINGKLIEEDTRSGHLIMKMKEENLDNFIAYLRFTNKKDIHKMRVIQYDSGYAVYGFNLELIKHKG